MSPLRYPGGKRRLTPYLQRVLEINELRPKLFVEPFAGGASASLQLLQSGTVDQVGLADLDPYVASFWRVALEDTEWLTSQVESIEVTLEAWERMKRGRFATERAQALACLFLNRTSFSGILAPTAGPIGGKKQEGPYTLDCRFPRKRLIKRIEAVARLRHKVAFVWNLPWRSTMARVQAMQRRQTLPKEAFFYLDPPFFEKAERLYRKTFTLKQHKELREFLFQFNQPWLLSYDAVPGVESLYKDAEAHASHVELLYSSTAAGGGRKQREIIISNLATPSRPVRLWQEADSWRRNRRPFIGTDEEWKSVTSVGGALQSPREVVLNGISRALVEVSRGG